MKVKLFVAALAFAIAAFVGSLQVAAAPTVVLDQQQINQTGELSDLLSFHEGQTFTAGVSGLLSRVEVRWSCTDDPTGVFALAAGDLPLGTAFPESPLHTQDFDVTGVVPTCAAPSGSTVAFDISPGVPIQAGNSYTFAYKFEAGTVLHVSQSLLNGYLSGHYYLSVPFPGSENRDLVFKTFVTVDSDGDGVCDPGASEVQCTGVDACPATAEGASVNSRGCAATAADRDADGVCNRGASGTQCSGTDHCANTPASAAEVDSNGCSQQQVDSDMDGVCNRGVVSSLCEGSDRCSNTAAGAQVDSNGCAEIQVDSNLDGVCNRGATSDTWCHGARRMAPRRGAAFIT